MKFNTNAQTTVYVIKDNGEVTAVQADVKLIDNKWAQITVPSQPDKNIPKNELVRARAFGDLDKYTLPENICGRQVVWPNGTPVMSPKAPWYNLPRPNRFTTRFPASWIN